MANDTVEKASGLVGLEVCKLEPMHNGRETFFTGSLANGLGIMLRKADGLSPAGREQWQLSFVRRKHSAGARTGRASGHGSGHTPYRSEG